MRTFSQGKIRTVTMDLINRMPIALDCPSECSLREGDDYSAVKDTWYRERLSKADIKRLTCARLVTYSTNLCQADDLFFWQCLAALWRINTKVRSQVHTQQILRELPQWTNATEKS